MYACRISHCDPLAKNYYFTIYSNFCCLVYDPLKCFIVHNSLTAELIKGGPYIGPEVNTFYHNNIV